MPARPPSLRLPHGWTQFVRTGVLHVISLAQFALTQSRGRIVRGHKTLMGHSPEIDRRDQEIAMLREELRIKDARMAQLAPQQRPHYPPQERMAILEMRAARD